MKECKRGGGVCATPFKTKGCCWWTTNGKFCNNNIQMTSYINTHAPYIFWPSSSFEISTSISLLALLWAEFFIGKDYGLRLQRRSLNKFYLSFECNYSKWRRWWDLILEHRAQRCWRLGTRNQVSSSLTHWNWLMERLGWGVRSFVHVGENLPYQVKSFFSTDKSILLTLIENLYFTLLLIRQKIYDRDCLVI